MRKVAVVFGLVGLGFLLLLASPQLGVSQMNLLALQEPDVSPEELQLEISILKTINEMELTPEQMTTLRDNIAQIRVEQDSVNQAKLELREFLMDFKGTREELVEAIVPFQERVDDAERMFSENMINSLDQIRDVLSMRQGDILRQNMRSEHRILQHLPNVHMIEPHVAPDAYNFNFNGNIDIDEEALDRLEEKLELYEERMEAWGEQMGEWGERLGERLGERFERLFGRLESGDGIRIYHNGELYNIEQQIASELEKLEHIELPQINVEFRSGYDHIRSGITSSILDHLEVWERVLTEKIERVAQPVTGAEDSI